MRGFYLSILGDDIFHTLERMESNQPYYTTLRASVLADALRCQLRLILGLAGYLIQKFWSLF